MTDPVAAAKRIIDPNVHDVPLEELEAVARALLDETANYDQLEQRYNALEDRAEKAEANFKATLGHAAGLEHQRNALAAALREIAGMVPERSGVGEVARAALAALDEPKVP